MTAMKRLLSYTPALLGSLLLSSCLTPDPYSPYGAYDSPQNRPAQDYGPYGNPNGNPNGPQPPQSDPYGNPPPSYGQQGIQDPTYNNQPPSRPEPPKYPTAEKTRNPDQVLSPYAPYNVIDVSDFKSGQLAKDPSNKKIFIVP
jgi:hypothetical protein